MSVASLGRRAWLGDGDPRSRGQRVTMSTIVIVRRWAESVLGLPSHLEIIADTNVIGRNRVLLRFAGVGEAEVSALRDLHAVRNRYTAAHVARTLRKRLGNGPVDVV